MGVGDLGPIDALKRVLVQAERRWARLCPRGAGQIMHLRYVVEDDGWAGPALIDSTGKTHRLPDDCLQIILTTQPARPPEVRVRG